MVCNKAGYKVTPASSTVRCHPKRLLEVSALTKGEMRKKGKSPTELLELELWRPRADSRRRTQPDKKGDTRGRATSVVGGRSGGHTEGLLWQHATPRQTRAAARRSDGAPPGDREHDRERKDFEGGRERGGIGNGRRQDRQWKSWRRGAGQAAAAKAGRSGRGGVGRGASRDCRG